MHEPQEQTPDLFPDLPRTVLLMAAFYLFMLTAYSAGLLIEEGFYRLAALAGHGVAAEARPDLALPLLALAAAVALGGMLLLARRLSGQGLLEFCPPGRFDPPAAALLLPGALGLAVLASETDNIMRYWIPLEEAIESTPPEPAWLQAGAGFLLGVLLYPLVSELLFRGMALRVLLERRPPGAAIGAAALLGAVFFLNPYSFIGHLADGLLLGWVYAQTRSLGTLLAVHWLRQGLAWAISLQETWVVRGFNSAVGPGEVEFHPLWFDLTGLALLALSLFGLEALFAARRRGDS